MGRKADLLEKNAAIIYNECLFLANQICTNKTISGHPILITGGDPYFVSGIAPNIPSGIANPRFGNSTAIEPVIAQAISKSKRILKNKNADNKSSLADGSQSKNASVRKIINSIKSAKKSVTKDNFELVSETFISEVIKTTATDIIKKRLITPVRLPSATLNLYAQQITYKTIFGDHNYGLYNLNLLIISSILKIINF